MGSFADDPSIFHYSSAPALFFCFFWSGFCVTSSSKDVKVGFLFVCFMYVGDSPPMGLAGCTIPGDSPFSDLIVFKVMHFVAASP
jgi:hypothetical protein